MAQQRLGLVDLAVQGVGNVLMTDQAAKSPDLRWTWGQPGQPSSPYRDYRFAATLGGAAMVALTGTNSAVGRAGFDIAAAAGHSFLATERIRTASIQRMAAPAGGGQLPGGAPPQLAPPVASAPQGLPTGVFANFFPGQFS